MQTKEAGGDVRSSCRGTGRMAEATARLVRRLRLLERREISRCGVPFAQGMVLRVLHQDRRQRMSALADEVGVAQSTATRLVEPLVRESLVRRGPAPEDRRAVEVELTADGRQVAERLEGGSRRCCEGILERIPEEKREQVVEALELLSRAADKCCTDVLRDPRIPTRARDQKRGSV